MGGRKPIMSFWKINSARKEDDRDLFNFPREFKTKQALINFAKSKGLKIVEASKFDELGQELQFDEIRLS